MAVPGKIKKQPVIWFITVLINKFLKSIFKPLTIRISN